MATTDATRMNALLLMDLPSAAGRRPIECTDGFGACPGCSRSCNPACVGYRSAGESPPDPPAPRPPPGRPASRRRLWRQRHAELAHRRLAAHLHTMDIGGVPINYADI